MPAVQPTAPVSGPPTPPPATPARPGQRAAQRRKKRAQRRRTRQERCRRKEARRRCQIATLASSRTCRRIRVADLAGFFGFSERSLYRWQHTAADPDGWVPLGRTPKQAPNEVRNALFSYLSQHGSRIGVPRLRRQFPQVGKREMEEFVRRFKAVERHRNGKLLHRLTWLKPGATWTMDFTEPAAALEHPYRSILCVRDLGSGRTLVWQPVEHDDSATVVAILAGLFARYGAPLVIKSDNGPHFRGDLPAFLDKHGVLQLYSPVYTPSYNGACEAGQGSLKIRAHEFACRAGHPELWTCDDLEGARLQANEAQSDWQSVVADDAPPLYHGSLDWSPVPDCERVAFARAVAAEELKLQKEITDTEAQEDSRLRAQRLAAIRRKVISRACVARDLLAIRRKRVTTPI